VIIDHYYEPMFKYNGEYTEAVRPSPDLFKFDLEAQKKLLSKLDYSAELIEFDFAKEPESLADFHLPNGSFESGDAEFLYSMVRHFKPSKVIEIGSGHSSKIASLALGKNQSENRNSYEHILVEPYPKDWLATIEGTDVRISKIENCGFDWSVDLKSGDLLFIDSSHMIRPGGDVLKEYLEILPKLASGVIIHIHDIFTPMDYLERWREDNVLFWNEQYLVEAILANSDRYSVIAALNYLKHECYADLKRVCPYLDPAREPGSLYLIVN